MVLLHPGPQPGAALQPLRLLAHRRRFAAGTAVTGMAPYRGAKPIEVGLGVWIDSGSALPHLIKVDLADPGAPRRLRREAASWG
jgi:hypothetical protein